MNSVRICLEERGAGGFHASPIITFPQVIIGGVAMASREEMMDTIEKAYAARASGDMENLMTAFHSDGAFELMGDSKELLVAGRAEGHDGVRAAMDGFVKNFEFLKRDILDSVIEGDRAVVHSRLQIRFVPKDNVFTTDVLDVFRFKDGKIVQLVEFADTALVKSVMS
jgi:ketosteroid isomerase-like protein